MPLMNLSCARCTAENHPAIRFCESCGLPLGTAEPDAEAAFDALGPYEAPEPSASDAKRLARKFAEAAGFRVSPAIHGWRCDVPLRHDRHQAVYVGPTAFGPESRIGVSLVSVCGPANARDALDLLMINTHAAEAHYAVKVLRGESYFIVVSNLVAELLPAIDPKELVNRIATLADGLEGRLTRGRDLF
jgi:hypothetical protein